MFNSQKINKDRMPYVVDLGLALGEFRSSEDCGSHWDSHDTSYKPRPEYDNNPNPILVAFREQCNWEQTTPEGRAFELAEWVWWLGDEAHSVYKFQSAEHIAHARKVLERLVNVYG